MVSPSTIPMETAPDSRFVVADAENVTVSSRLQFSATKRAVISFVILAG